MTLNFMKPRKQLSIAGETYDHFTVYAEGLGLGDMNKELIDICSLYLDDIKPKILASQEQDLFSFVDNHLILSLDFQSDLPQKQNLSL